MNVLHRAAKDGKVKRTEDMVRIQKGQDERERLGKAIGKGTDTPHLS